MHNLNLDNLPEAAKYLAADVTPFYQTVLAWIYVVVSIGLILYSTWLKGRKGRWLLGGVGLIYIAYATIAVIWVANRTGDFGMGIPLQGYGLIIEGGRRVDVDTSLQFGYYLTYIVGFMCIALALFRNIIAGKPKLNKENDNNFDGFIIACHDDPNLDVMKEITKKPVVGIGESSMKMASMLGHRFSVVSTMKHSIPNKEALIRKYHLQDLLASVRAPSDEMATARDEEKYLQAAQFALEEDMAEVIVLGCAGMAGLDRHLEEKLGAPVLDGVVCALIIATGLVKYGVSTSKVRRYSPEY